MDSYTFENLSRIAKSDAVKEIYDKIKSDYDERYANRAPRELTYAKFKRIYTDGDRAEWQAEANDLLTELSHLRFLALTDDKYIEPLEQAVFEMCNQFTWAWPAHSYDADGRFDYGFIDLRVAEYAYMLAELVHVYGDKLSADIRDRVVLSIKSKVVDNYENRTFWWEEEVNNWLAVCAGGIGMAYLYCFPERLNMVKDRLFSTFDRFISQIPDDGAYTEGVGYLDFALSNFCLFCHTYREITGETPELIDSPKARRAVEFLNDSAFDGGLYIPFSDGWGPGFERDSAAAYTIKALYPETIVPQKLGYKNACNILLYRLLVGIDEFGKSQENTTKVGTTYYASSQWLLKRCDKYNFIAKCGNNSEMHNHCDVGTFEINRSGKKIISDPGAAVYTYQYFNDLTENGRYGKDILLASSWAHSVPIVNEKAQYGYGAWTVKEPYAGKVLYHDDNRFTMDIAGTYQKGEVDSLVIDYQLFDDKVLVRYDAKGVKESIAFRFVTELIPTLDDGKVSLGDAACITSLSKIEAQISNPDYQNKRTDLYMVDYVVPRSGDVIEEFEIKLK